MRYLLVLGLLGCATEPRPTKAAMGCDYYRHARDYVAYRACRDSV